ncbi:hypothetical protein CsSME_00032526 [Camellia sinensis var. sinensis]
MNNISSTVSPRLARWSLRKLSVTSKLLNRKVMGLLSLEVVLLQKELYKHIMVP